MAAGGGSWKGGTFKAAGGDVSTSASVVSARRQLKGRSNITQTYPKSSLALLRASGEFNVEVRRAPYAIDANEAYARISKR